MIPKTTVNGAMIKKITQPFIKNKDKIVGKKNTIV